MDTPDQTLNLRQLREALSGDTAVVPSRTTVRKPMPDAVLVCICPSGPSLGQRYTVGSMSVLIGREATCNVAIADGGVSRAHARIERQTDGTYRIEDLNSTNGTYVNNARIRAYQLQDGDYLRVGGQIFRFLASDNIEADYHEEIHRLTILDPLTGIHNRRYLDEHLEREVDRARRHGRPLSVVLVDIDHFKQINDRFGHTAGDFALQNLAVRLIGLTRKDELLARYGGEEFALILPETELDKALLCGERLRRAVAEQPFEFEGEQYTITVSVGVATLTLGDSYSPAELLNIADQRLYEAKRAGRNRVAPLARIRTSSRIVAVPPRVRPSESDPESPNPTARP